MKDDNEPKYIKGLVYFIDILGTRGYSFNDLYKINTIFHKKLSDLQVLKPFQLDRYITSFSDCAYIVDTGKADFNDPIAFSDLLFLSFSTTADSIAYFVANGFLCRGGIAFGDVFIDNTRNIIFGPAVNRAYLLEQEAKMPRLIIDEELMKRIMESTEEKNDPIFTDKDVTILPRDPIDNKYYFNYLFWGENDIGKKTGIKLNKRINNMDDYYRLAKKYSEIAIKNATSYDVIAKHKWHLDFLEKVWNAGKVDLFGEDMDDEDE